MKVNDLSYKRRSWIHKCHKLGWIPIKHHLNERLPYNLPGFKCCDIIYDWSWKEKCLVDLKQLFLWHSFTNCEKKFEAWFDLFSKNKQIIFNVKNKATRARHFHTLLVKITVINNSHQMLISNLYVQAESDLSKIVWQFRWMLFMEPQVGPKSFTYRTPSYKNENIFLGGGGQKVVIYVSKTRCDKMMRGPSNRMKKLTNWVEFICHWISFSE